MSTKLVAPTNYLHDACFIAGTLVHTKDGLRPIEEIKVGDWVMTNAEDAVMVDHQDKVGDPIYRQVTETFVTENMQVIEIIFIQPNGKYGYLHVTPNHLFKINERGWVPAHTLKFPDALMLEYFGNSIVAYMAEQKSQTATVYNIKVDEFHTYFVSHYGVWVHNCGRDSV